jgi:hypothetical protein
MSKKQLDTEAVFSELTNQSSFFKRSSTPPTNEPERDDAETERTETRTENRSEMRSPALRTKRLTRRYSFEFYDDQVTQVKKIKHELEMAGERVSLSDIVRQALDKYLDEERMSNRTENRSEMRTNEEPNG